MKLQELRKLIREEISKVPNEEGSIKGHINDVTDRLNNLPFGGGAFKKGNEIYYYLDDKDINKYAKKVEKIANILGWKLKTDKDPVDDDILIFILK